MFEGSSSINIFDLKRDSIAINLEKITIITKDGDIYKNMYALCRLLSIEEIRRIDTVNNDTPTVHDALEESILKECLVDFIGLDKDIVDWERSDAGLIPRIANAVILKSISIITDPLSKIPKMQSEISLIESIGAIVSRYLNISYIDVLELPINKLLRYYALCKKTFPSDLGVSESNSYDDE
jgi:hypothetical protein